MSDFAGMEDLLQDFLQEASDLLSDVDNKLVDLERSPEAAGIAPLRHLGSHADDDAGDIRVAGGGVDHGPLLVRVVHDGAHAAEDRPEDAQGHRRVPFSCRDEHGFLGHLPFELLKHPDNDFVTPSEAIDRYPSFGELDIHNHGQSPPRRSSR